jgi:BolA family transcriptional regulator, general stress-responsive regulator
MDTKDKIAKILRNAFAIQYIDITDDSHLHRGHREVNEKGGGHFTVLIVSPDFSGKKLIERHRMVYGALKQELKTEVHALAIKALTPEEYIP